jgi:methyl-accepting chemotaxis protein
MLKNMRIGTRLGMGFAIATVFLLVIAVLSVFRIGTIGSSINQVLQDKFPKTVLSNEIMDHSDAAAISARNVLLMANKDQIDAELKSIQENRGGVTDVLARLDKMVTTPKGRELFAAMTESRVPYARALDEFLDLVKGEKKAEAVEQLEKKVKPAQVAFFKVIDDFVAYQTGLMEKEGQKAEGLYRSSMVIVAVLGIIALGGMAGICIWITRSIVQPIRQTISQAELLAKGDIAQEIVVDRKDEFGDQAVALKAMVEKWREIIVSVKQASDSVAASSTQLSANAGEMSDSAGQQADRAQLVATASEEMSQTVESIAGSASSIASTATHAATTARNGGKTVQEAVQEVTEIAATVNESAEHITSLADLSKRIGEIIGIIDEIADQTNLLALNAAIEAARAGEHGRGFAVVADEVRKLAERTTGATSEVSGIIKEIQGKVTNAVSSIQQVRTKVDRGVALSNRAGGELGMIVDNVDELQQMIHQIASAIEEMSATSDQISRDIESISGLSAQTSRASAEVHHASTELSRLGVTLQDIGHHFQL